MESFRLNENLYHPQSFALCLQSLRHSIFLTGFGLKIKSAISPVVIMVPRSLSAGTGDGGMEEALRLSSINLFVA